MNPNIQQFTTKKGLFAFRWVGARVQIVTSPQPELAAAPARLKVMS